MDLKPRQLVEKSVAVRPTPPGGRFMPRCQAGFAVVSSDDRKRSVAMRPPAARKPPPAARVMIERVGAEGDGTARLPDLTALYVPMTLPGELVQAEPLRPRGDGWLAKAVSIEAAGKSRVEPPCPRFGHCGGCVLQQWRDADYQAWMAGVLEAALRRGGVAPLPSLSFPPRLSGGSPA